MSTDGQLTLASQRTPAVDLSKKATALLPKKRVSFRTRRGAA